MIIGLLLLLGGANYLVDSSVAIAKRAKISNFIIGITIVGMGTSAPELLVSVKSAISGIGDMAVGNVLGSNICNILFILGTTAIIAPFAIERETLRRDIPIGVISAILLFIICCDTIFRGSDVDGISRSEGIFLLIAFVAFLYFTVFKSMGSKKATTEIEDEVKTQLNNLNIWLLILVAIISLGLLLYGGNLFLDNAIITAKELGLSEAVISITIVALGTSLPELITCIIAAIKGNAQLALGNVIGSNIFNILLILGLSATISPIQLSNVNIIDFIVLLISTILIFVVAFTFGKRRMDRIEGIIFVLLYFSYSGYLLMR